MENPNYQIQSTPYQQVYTHIPLLTSTTFEIPGYTITENLGLVRGIVVRSPTIVQGFLGGLKTIIGGQIGAFTEMCEQARAGALKSMVEHAQALGANAIVGIRYDASDLGSKYSAAEVLCYGTAVKVKPLPKSQDPG